MGSLADIQRERILDAMVGVACEAGAANVTVAHVVRRAGVSRRTFYETFSGSGDCLIAALEHGVERAAGRVLPAYRSERSWAGRMRAALWALLGLFDEDPELARLLIVESQGAGAAARQLRARTLASLVAAVDGGRAESRAGAALTPVTAEGVVGAVLAVLYARLQQAGPRESRLDGHAKNGRLKGALAMDAARRTGSPHNSVREPLSGLVNELASMVVLPYLGTAAARRELMRAPRAALAPARTGDAATMRRDLFKEAGIRLTYRTTRVLAAIAEHPGASNRQVAVLAGTGDQGQASKLLTRLERLELISNRAERPTQGAPNAWHLTTTGRQVAERVRGYLVAPQTAPAARAGARTAHNGMTVTSQKSKGRDL